MLTQRLAARCKSAQLLGVASAAGYALRFHKSSKDGSGKATLIAAPDETIYGVLFNIAKAELPALDRAEGVGYGYDRENAFAVRYLASGEEIRAATYLAANTAIDPSLAPFDWYHALVIAGATQNGLPGDYIAKLAGVVAHYDSDLQRKGRLDALAALEAYSAISSPSPSPPEHSRLARART